MAILRSANATDVDITNCQWTSAVQTNAITSVVVPAPTTGELFLPWMMVGYSGAGTGTLTITGTTKAISQTITGSSGAEIYLSPDPYFDSSQGNVTVSLPAGGVGIVGYVIVGYEWL